MSKSGCDAKPAPVEVGAGPKQAEAADRIELRCFHTRYKARRDGRFCPQCGAAVSLY